MNLIRLPEGVIPFDETYILYKEGDLMGGVCCILALAPILILQSYLTWFIIDRDVESLYVVVGQLSNEVLNKILKRVFKHTRPMQDGLTMINSNDSILSFGMPSAHCQFMGFFTSYIIVNMWCRWRYKIEKRDKLLYSILIVLLSLSVCISRWYLQYHHWDQIIIGYEIGMFVGMWYYMSVVVLIAPLSIHLTHYPFVSYCFEILHILKVQLYFIERYTLDTLQIYLTDMLPTRNTPSVSAECPRTPLSPRPSTSNARRVFPSASVATIPYCYNTILLQAFKTSRLPSQGVTKRNAQYALFSDICTPNSNPRVRLSHAQPRNIQIPQCPLLYRTVFQCVGVLSPRTL